MFEKKEYECERVCVYSFCILCLLVFWQLLLHIFIFARDVSQLGKAICMTMWSCRNNNEATKREPNRRKNYQQNSMPITRVFAYLTSDRAFLGQKINLFFIFLEAMWITTNYYGHKYLHYFVEMFICSLSTEGKTAEKYSLEKVLFVNILCKKKNKQKKQ